MQTYPDVAAYVTALKRLLKVSSDQQLADEIGVAKQTIASWRKRGGVPLAVEAELAAKYGPEAAFSSLVRAATDRREDEVLYALSYYIRRRFHQLVPNAVGELADIRWAMVMIDLEPELRSFIREFGFDMLNRDEVFSAIALEIRGGAFPEIQQLVDQHVRPAFSAEADNEADTRPDIDRRPDPSNA